MSKHFKKAIIIAASAVICGLMLVITYNRDNFSDTVKYKGKTYSLLEYNMDIFTYHFNNNRYLEEDKIHPVSNKKWDTVYFNGDIFVAEKQADKAIDYYADDKNYNWFVTFDKSDGEVKAPLCITQKELEYLYNMESLSRENTMVFEDIQQFASIVKQSRDGFVFALITLARCDNNWYWKTEVMTDDNREYIIPLPDSLNKRLSFLAQLYS